MDKLQLYGDIAERTQGDIYIGVVGPVRTGKSTFIKRFVERIVLPNIDNEHIRARVSDELPQSAGGRTIMTTEPKFIPNEAVRIELAENRYCNVRMVDCVGYLVPGALGHTEEDAPRMVRTPWYEDPIPFVEAAELGTRKVILEHATIGVVMTTDGTVTELERASYVEAEERVISEMLATGKPFVIVVNSREPEGDAAQSLVKELSKRYDASVCAMNAQDATAAQMQQLIDQVLMEFPIRLIEIKLPSYMMALPPEHALLSRVMLPVLSALPKLRRLRDYDALVSELSGIERFQPPHVTGISMGEGVARLSLQPEESLFYEVLSEQCGCEIENDRQLVEKLSEFAEAKQEYDRIASALLEAKQTGYGIVAPDVDDMQLDEPMIVRQGNRFGVRLRARASGMHLIRVDVDSEVNPVIGTEQQSEALVQYINDTFTTDPQAIWQTNIFGKPLYDLVRDGMEQKSDHMAPTVRERMQTTLGRIVNEGCNGVICIML